MYFYLLYKSIWCGYSFEFPRQVSATTAWLQVSCEFLLLLLSKCQGHRPRKCEPPPTRGGGDIICFQSWFHMSALLLALNSCQHPKSPDSISQRVLALNLCQHPKVVRTKTSLCTLLNQWMDVSDLHDPISKISRWLGMLEQMPGHRFSVKTNFYFALR